MKHIVEICSYFGFIASHSCRITLYCIAVSTLFCISGCTSTSNPPAVFTTSLPVNFGVPSAGKDSPALREKPVANAIAAGNLIKIESLDDEKLSGEFRVNVEGKLLLPYQVELYAAGLSIDEFRSELQKRFQPYFRSPPLFTVQILDKSVFVKALGLVSKPGTYLVSATSGLDELLGQSGGLEKNVSGQTLAAYAAIDSAQGKSTIKLAEYFSGNPTGVSLWQGGETVFFQSTNEQGQITDLFNPRYVQVVGQVRSPGEYLYTPNSNLFGYLLQAGGPTDRANTNKMLLVRVQGSQVQAFPVGLDKLNEAPVMQGGDVLFVQADNPSELQKDASVFGSLASVVSSIATTVLVGVGL